MAFTPFPNEIYTTFSFLGFIMCIIPLPWHLKAWNGGTCLYMFWTGIGCLIFFINSIVWHGNAFNPAPIWCDICVRILIGSSIGIPASSLCINRRLYLLQLDFTGKPDVTKSYKMRVLAVDLGISAGLPILIMILQYIPQGHRFNILEDIGCVPFTYPTWVGIIIVFLPPVLIGLVSATYAVRAIISINKRRNAFNELLSCHLNVTSSLYFRLMLLAGIEAILTVPLAVFFLVMNLTHIRPWISWEDTHISFNRVDQFPAIIWHTFHSPSTIEFTRWIYILCSILFFSFFGFAEEARFHYRLAIETFLQAIGIRIDRRTEIITFQAGAQSDLATFGNKNRRRAGSFSTISMVSTSSNGIRDEKERQRSVNTRCNTQDSTHEHLGTQNPRKNELPRSLSAAGDIVRPLPVIAHQADIEKTPQRNSLLFKNTQDIEQASPVHQLWP